MGNVVERIKRVVSYSEIEAFKVVARELNGEKKQIIVASKLADRAGVTRSVVVNAFKLLEIAGVIETRSLGMKGTCITVLDQEVVNELISW